MRKIFEGDEVKIDFEKVNDLYFSNLPRDVIKNPLAFAKRKRGKVIESTQWPKHKKEKFWVHCVEFNCGFQTKYWFTEDELMLS